MTPAEIATLREQEKAASPAPWMQYGSEVRTHPGHEMHLFVKGYALNGLLSKNAALITAARNALPALLEELESLQLKLAKAGEEVEAAVKTLLDHSKVLQNFVPGSEAHQLQAGVDQAHRYLAVALAAIREGR